MPPSDTRLIIEKALQEAERPPTPGDLAFVTGIDIDVVRRFLSEGVRWGRMTNLGTRRGESRYMWGKEAPKASSVVTRFVPTGTYDGGDLKKPPPRGESSMHAYSLPSLGFGSCAA